MPGCAPVKAKRLTGSRRLSVCMSASVRSGAATMAAYSGARSCAVAAVIAKQALKRAAMVRQPVIQQHGLRS